MKLPKDVIDHLEREADKHFNLTIQHIDEGLPLTSAHSARWVAQLVFEIHPELRVK